MLYFRFIVKKSRIDKQKENEENFTEEDITEEEDQGNNNEPYVFRILPFPEFY